MKLFDEKFDWSNCTPNDIVNIKLIKNNSNAYLDNLSVLIE